MQEVFPNVYMIPVPLTGNPLKELNCFVIMGSNRNLVVDVGFDTEEGRERIKSGLKELKCDPECTDLFITHAHEDHIGAMVSLREEGCLVVTGNIKHFPQKDFVVTPSEMIYRMNSAVKENISLSSLI